MIFSLIENFSIFPLIKWLFYWFIHSIKQIELINWKLQTR